jgi:N-acetylmuramoyl-L-alanine amidase CwlA
MCLEADGKPSDITVMTTLDLVRALMNKYDIGIDRVVRHYDASRKICPNSFCFAYILTNL